jgi:hypothetical protein
MKELKNEIQEIDSSVNPVPRTELRNVWGMFQTVSSAPTAVPLSFQNQIQIYTNGATYRLYWYDVTNNTWHYVSATS